MPTIQTRDNNLVRVADSTGWSVRGFGEDSPLTPEETVRTNAPATYTKERFGRHFGSKDMQNRNNKLLESFTKYCKENPQERFWQALRNWAKDTFNPKLNYILTAERNTQNMVGYENLRDTFYDE